MKSSFDSFLSLIVWVSPFYVLVEISLVFELAATLSERAVLGQLWHVVHQRIQEAAELRDLDELFLGGHFLINK
jgi:hypothetical protein